MNAPMTKMKVLAVDDNRTNLHILQVFLKKLGHDVILAENGEEAVRKFETDAPDLVLLDIEMPRMDGYQFAEHMKGDPRTARVPIIMITSRIAEKHRQRAQEIGVEGYLGKPYQEVELMRSIRGLLDAKR